jgi:lipoprotein-releasing system permease protein
MHSRRSVIGFAFAQIVLFLSVLAQLLLGGVLLSIVRREFSWRAFVASFILVAAVSSVAGYVAFNNLTLDSNQLQQLFGLASLFSFCLAGVVAARLSRTLAFWESYLLCLVVGIAAFAYFGQSGNASLGLSPGLILLGSMWQRLLGLGLFLGLMLMVFSSSCTHLFYGEKNQWNGSFAAEWFVTKRHLTGKSGLVSVTAVVAVVGIALGVASLIVVTSVMSGYQADIQNKILGTNAHLVVQKFGVEFSEYPLVTQKILATDGILAAAPFTFNEAILSDGKRGLGVLVKGIHPTESDAVTGFARQLCTDETCVKTDPQKLAALADEGEVPTIIVGFELFKQLHQPIGSLVTLTTPIGIAAAGGQVPKRLQFRLRGIFRSGMHEFDARLVYLSLKASQRLLGLGGSVSGIEIKVHEPEQVELYSRKVLSTLGHYPYRTLDWRELNSGIFTALSLQKIVMFLVLTFIVIVAAFNIASTLFMAVVEKSHDIAVLKSMGARDVSIMKIFVLHGWMTGGLGTLLGLGLGLGLAAILAQLKIAIAADVYMVGSLQVRVRVVEVVLVVASALIISHLATLYPALKAARQHPVDAMRDD